MVIKSTKGGSLKFLSKHKRIQHGGIKTKVNNNPQVSTVKQEMSNNDQEFKDEDDMSVSDSKEVLAASRINTGDGDGTFLKASFTEDYDHYSYAFNVSRRAASSLKSNSTFDNKDSYENVKEWNHWLGFDQKEINKLASSIENVSVIDNLFIDKN